MRRCIAALLVVVLFPYASLAQGFKVSPGFEVVEFADGKLANDIHVMTVDPKGRVVVAGRGYIRILVDDNGDGKADRALPYADTPKDGAMGLLWEGNTLWVTGDGGLRRFTSKFGDKADGPSELIRAMKTSGEHTTHAVRRGPDGWFYVLCGNTAGIDKSYAELPTSPIREPIAGCVLRFPPSSSVGGEAGVRGKIGSCEIVAHGFRNPYSFDFNLEGDLFTFDSDNERCVSLPWYEPTRFYHVIEGRHYGWLNPQHAVTWRRPPYFCDVVAPIATLGRGSPTGVACYDHNQFPPDYHGGFFLCDWTFGKIHFVSLERKGATYTTKKRVFLESTGDDGFAPTACAIDPKTGDLYVSIGGRGTRGAVYRVRHLERFKAMQGKLASLPRKARPLEWNESTRKEYEKSLWSKSSEDHLWALQMARRQMSFLGDDKVSSPFAPKQYFDDLSIRCAQADLTDDLLRMVPPRQADALKRAILKNENPAYALSTGLGILLTDPETALNRGLFLVQNSKFPERRVEGIRLIQLALGDVGPRKAMGSIWEGYAPRRAIKDDVTARRLARLFPSKHSDLDRELARTLGMLGHADVEFRRNVLKKCGEISTGPMEDIHYLACYARLEGKRTGEETKQVACSLLDLDRKIRAGKLNQDSNWAPRVRELYLGLAEVDPALPQAMVECAEFGRPDHAMFANTAGFPKEKAARIFLGRWKRDKEFAVNPNVIQLFHALPADEVLPIIRQRWSGTSHDAGILALLAKKPVDGDRPKFVQGLNSPQTEAVFVSVEGLNKLGYKTNDLQTLALIQALHRAPHKQIELRNALIGRLQKTTGESLGGDSKRWIAWFTSINSELGKRLANPDGVDVTHWNARLAKLEWNGGDAERGRTVFAKANCLTCHSGSQSLGPDLVGVANRFSRADLFAAILQPSKDVPARYQMTIVETKDGKTYQGIVIYDAVDSLILQTGAASTVRLDGPSVENRSVSGRSLMPAGLLDPLSDRDIADLYAFLKKLK